MKDIRLKVALVLFVLGLLGVFSLLTTEIPLNNLPDEAIIMYTPEQIRWLLLLNPLVLMILALVAGALLFQRNGLELPLIVSALNRKFDGRLLLDQLKWAAILGVPSGVLIYFYAMGSSALLPDEFEQLGANFQPGVLVKLLYGGITEEILLRFGLMNLLVWLLLLIFRKKSPALFWSGIVVSALLFGVGHLGVLFQSVNAPSLLMILYVIIGNTFAGIVFGWLYWRKGLESSMFSHMIMHLTMVACLAILG
jgi:membrane protease YdiL (CAAX protease family)